MSETKRKGKDLLDHLSASGKLEYGTVIMAEEVRLVLGIEFPDTASKRTFDSLALQELAGVDYVRNVLLGQGKYLGQDKGNYRILLPSENADQVRNYMGSADNKLRRALKLWDNTPAIDDESPTERSNISARILLKRHGIKNRSVLGKDDEDT